MNKKVNRVAPAAMYALQQHGWPGNFRELENAVERAMVVAQEPELRETDFLLKSQNGGRADAGVKTLGDMERAHILRVLEECSWNQTRTAEVLDIDRVTLHNKLNK
jgi:two-component system response regulator HydG